MARPLATSASPSIGYAAPRRHTHRGYWRMPGKYPLYLMEGERSTRRRCEGGGASGPGGARGGPERSGREHESMAAFSAKQSQFAADQGLRPRRHGEDRDWRNHSQSPTRRRRRHAKRLGGPPVACATASLGMTWGCSRRHLPTGIPRGAWRRGARATRLRPWRRQARRRPARGTGRRGGPPDRRSGVGRRWRGACPDARPSRPSCCSRPH